MGLGFVLGATAQLAAGLPTNTAPAAVVPPQVAAPVANASPGPAPANTNGARIKFATPVYDFGRAKAGDLVKYTYYFTNTGTDTLELKSVAPSCGCTAAGEFSRQVPPGETGAVPIQFNGAHFNGPVFKTITVNCTDPTQPICVLQLKGTVWKPVDFFPAYTILTIPPDATNASATVRITNNMPEPLVLMAPQSSLPSFTAELKTNNPGREFLLTVSANPPLNPGGASGKVTLKTDTTNTLEVPFWANIQPALQVFPSTVMLPAAPMPNRATPSVMIQNNSTQQITLSDPSINVPGVEVVLKEVQTNRVFSLQFSVPPEFEIPKGQQVFLTAKTTHPKFPLIRVPVLQMNRPQSPTPASLQRPPVGPALANPAAAPAAAKPVVTPPVIRKPALPPTAQASQAPAQ